MYLLPLHRIFVWLLKMYFKNFSLSHFFYDLDLKCLKKVALVEGAARENWLIQKGIIATVTSKLLRVDLW